jgi:DNA-binding transcriptional LysR family regulator
MDLRRLRYLVAVADEGHITRAAERLGIQQPPLTRQIQLLEEEVGAQLLHRHARGVSLTEAGAAVVAEARELVAAAERIAETARRAARGERGRITVGYTASAAFHPFVFRQVRAFRRAWPGVQLALEEGSSSELLTGLGEGRLDTVFIRTVGADPTGIAVEPLFEEPMLAALPADRPLAGQKSCALPDLAAEPFVFYRRPAGQGLYDAILAACHAAGFSPQIAQEAPRLPSTLSLVAAGLGVAIVPASMQRLNLEGVAWLRLEDAPGLVAPLMLATRRAGRGPIVERFRREALAAANETGTRT